LLIITGTMGAGKTTVLGEASDLLALRHIGHAAIDLDALGLAHLPSTASNDVVTYRNLQSICKNYASIWVTRFLVARAIEDRAELELCRSAVSASNTVVCGLAASIETMQQGVKMRESGVSRWDIMPESRNCISLLTAQPEDFIVTSEGRSVTEVAQEMLVRAEWISQ
jgi:hypothetical protein